MPPSALSLARMKEGGCESGEGCFTNLEAGGEIWERRCDGGKSPNGKAPFLISKYRPLPAKGDDE